MTARLAHLEAHFKGTHGDAIYDVLRGRGLQIVHSYADAAIPPCVTAARRRSDDLADEISDDDAQIGLALAHTAAANDNLVDRFGLLRGGELFGRSRLGRQVRAHQDGQRSRET